MLVVVFTAVVGAFFVSTVVVQQTSTDVDRLADNIVSNSTPSIAQLAAVRGSVLEVELALSRYIHEDESRELVRPLLDTALLRLDEGVQAYLRLPRFTAENRAWIDMHRAWAAFDEVCRRARELSDAGHIEHAGDLFVEKVEPAAARILDASVVGIELNAEHARTLAYQIKEIRARTVLLGNVLTASCVLLGLVGAFLLHRQMSRYRAEVQARSALMEARAEELEQFAGRVAHDVRNPLSAAKMACDLIRHRFSDEKLVDLIARIDRSLVRADAIISGLLDFARSGARPDPGARTNLQEAVADLVAGIAQEAEAAAIEIRVAPVPPLLAACSRGVYLSLVGNLLRNAIKYFDDRQPRRIEVVVTEEGPSIRTTITDTGPGIAPETAAHLFEPFFRGPSRGRDGIGLGLATVKKLAESHGGRVGVTSELGRGSSFWFVLPAAGSWAVEDSAPAQDEAKLLH
jgi:signal transduction histidine kinase